LGGINTHTHTAGNKKKNASSSFVQESGTATGEETGPGSPGKEIFLRTEKGSHVVSVYFAFGSFRVLPNFVIISFFYA